MILEGIVTTLDGTGRLNVAPMGPRVEPGVGRLVLRPFRTSTTCRNLQVAGEGVLHITDDVALLARAAIGPVGDVATRPASLVRGRILREACRYYEFRVVAIDDREERITMEAVTVASGRIRDPFGWNRAQFAVVEAAILATRVAILPLAEIRSKLADLAVLIDKTGGPVEREAFQFLLDHVEAAGRTQAIEGEDQGNRS